MNPTPFAFRILGGTDNERKLVDYRAAFRAYCAADPAALPEIPAYLSAFCYGDEFRHHLEATGSVRGYEGPVGVHSVKWDIDRDRNLEAAQRDTRRLAAFIVDHFRCDEGALLIGFSGSKGFHVELPVGWTIEPSPVAHLSCRRFAEAIASEVGVCVDTGVYDRVRPFRAWNSRHPKTGLYKVRIDLNDLLYASPEWIAGRVLPYLSRLTRQNPMHPLRSSTRGRSRQRSSVVRPRRNEHGIPALRGASVNALTWQLITDPGSVEVGSRHGRLFSAAANLAEFATIDDLVQAILTEPGLDTGLPPREVRRQIECGIEHARHQRGEGRTNG